MGKDKYRRVAREVSLSPTHGVYREADKSLSSMLVGKAIGGPLNGIKLSAGSLWDGMVKKNTQTGGNSYHAGHYKWTAQDSEDWQNDTNFTWVWLKGSSRIASRANAEGTLNHGITTND